MIFCPSSSSPSDLLMGDTTQSFSKNNKKSNGLLAMMMLSAAPLSRPSPKSLPKPGTPISILDFASMTTDQQKVWMEGNSCAQTTTRHTTALPGNTGRRENQDPESTLYTADKNPTLPSLPPLPLDDSSVSSDSYASDCEEERMNRIPVNKRCIFAPYWDFKSEQNGGVGVEEQPRFYSSSLLDGTIQSTRPRHQIERPLADAISAAVDFFHAPAVDRGIPLWQPSTVSSDMILPNLLRDLSFADALQLYDEARTNGGKDAQEEGGGLTSSRSVESLRSLSSILKNGSSTCLSSSSQQSSSTRTENTSRNKPPVSFDPRVQIIVFREDKPLPGPPLSAPVKLPQWVSRSLHSLLHEFGKHDDS